MSDDLERLDDSGLFGRSFSRRQALKLGALSLGGAIVSGLFPGRLFADAGGNSDCAHFCTAIFPPGPARGKCVSDAAHGTGVCGSCVGTGGFTCGGGVSTCPGTGPLGDACVCFTSSEGSPGCGGNDFCSNLVPCPNGQSDCPPGSFCAVNTCCGENVCVVDCGSSGSSQTRFTRSLAVGGMTATGR